MPEIAGKFIVVFKDSVSKDKVDEHATFIDNSGGKVTQKYGSLLNGFAAVIPENLLNSFQSSFAQEIDYIEPDSIVTTQTF